MKKVAMANKERVNIGIKHGFSCIIIRQEAV